MATQRLDIILNAQGQAEAVLASTTRQLKKVGKEMRAVSTFSGKSSAATNKFGSAMGGLGKSINKATAPLDRLLGGLGGLKGALKITLIAAAAKKMVDFAEGGAVLEAQLARLGNPINRTIKRLEKVQDAAGGVFSLEALAKAEIMQKELGVQLDFTGKDLEKLDARFTAMGMDGAKSLEQVITSLARSRKSFLQVLGLVKDLEGAYQRYADAQDIARRDLTELQKREALIMEVKANIQGIDLEAGRSVAAFEQMRAAIQDAFTYLKLASAPVGKVLKPIAEMIRDMAHALSGVLEPALKILVAALRPVLELFSLITQAVAKLLTPFRWLNNIVDVVSGNITHLSQSVQRLNDHYAAYINLNKSAVKQVQNLTVAQLRNALESIKNLKLLTRLEADRRINKATGDREKREALRKEMLKTQKELDTQANVLEGKLREIQEMLSPKWDIAGKKSLLDALKKELSSLDKMNNLTAVQIERRQELRTFRIPELALETGLFDIEQRRLKLISVAMKRHGAGTEAYRNRIALIKEEIEVLTRELKARVALMAVAEPTTRKPKGIRPPKPETPPADFSERLAMELRLHKLKQKHVTLARFEAHWKLKLHDLNLQIEKHAPESRKRALELFEARKASEKQAFQENISNKEFALDLDLRSLKHQDDAIAQAKIQWTRDMSILTLQKSRNELTEIEFQKRKEILDITLKQAIEDAKRQKDAKWWTELEGTMSNTSSVMGSMSSNMGTLTNAMAQGAAITSQHIGEKKSWNETTQAGIAVGQQAATAMVEDTQKQAAIAAVFETAKGFVALASGRLAAAGFHFAAAAIFGGIGATSGGDKAEKKQARSRDRRGGSGEGGQIIVNMGSGVVLGRPQDIGRAIGQATDAIFKTGMGRSAV